MIQMRSKRIIDEYHGFSFSRSSMAQNQKGKLYYPNNARFLPGKFGQAVLMEEGTTNLLPTNISNVETDTTGFYARNGSVISRDTTQHWEGNASLKVVTSSSLYTAGFHTDGISASPETAYTASIWLKGNVGGEVVRFIVSENKNIVMNISCTLTTEWQRFTGVATTLSTSTYLRLYVWNQAASEITFYADGLQIEKLPYPTTFVNGTRAAEKLIIPTEGVLNAEEGTIEFWVYEDGITTKSGFFWDVNRDSPYRPQLYRRGGSQYELFWDVNSTNRISCLIPPIGWHYLVVKWAETEIALYLDGVFVGDYTLDNPASDYISDATDIHIGCRYTNTAQLNSLIDDLRISNIARSDEEILAAYESNQPLPVDQYTTLKLGFDGPDGQRGAAIVTL